MFMIQKDFALTWQSIKRNALESPLLKLPTEIRDQVWKLVLGNSLFHVKFIPALRSYAKSKSQQAHTGWVHIICVAQRFEIEDYELRRATTRTDLPDSRSCGFHCIANMDQLGERLPPLDGFDQLQLGVLRSCRQVYVETNQILWTSNTFSFDDSRSFQKFIANRNSVQKQLLTKLRLDILLDDDSWNRAGPGLNGWLTAPSLNTARSLRALQVLHVHVLYEFGESSMILWKAGDKIKFIPFEGLLRLQTLPLKIVTTTIAEQCYGECYIELADKVSFIESLRTQLLDPNGADIQDQQAMKERERRQMMNEWKE